MFFLYHIYGDFMKVKIYDEEHEKDLEDKINEFFSHFEGKLIDIKYQVGIGFFSEEQVYCFSACHQQEQLPSSCLH